LFMRLVRLLVVFTLFATAAIAQSSPFLPEDTYRKLVNEISGDNAYDHLRMLTQFHSPGGVDRDFKRAAAWIESQAKDAGLKDVRFISLPSKRVPWSPISAEAWLIEKSTDKDGKVTVRETKLGSFKEVSTVLADNSRSTKAEAPVVDVGEGTRDSDYEGKDVKGKIVLASGSPTRVEELAVWQRGAIGILSHTSSRQMAMDFPDQVAWTRVNDKAKDGKEPTFAFVVSPRKGWEIRKKLEPPAPTSTAPKVEVSVRVAIASEILSESTQGIVEGFIRGTKSELKDQQVVLTAHIQEERFSANDDRSGCANLLEIARALNRMIEDGQLPRPERDIRFWWVNEIDGPYTYFAMNPDEAKKTFVNINQDMVGTNQTIGKASRVQHVSRTLWSTPTFFNDVVESIITSLYYGNNAYIDALQAGSTAPGNWYSRPIFSLLGSRDRYSVEIIPHMNNTDHMVFADRYIGTVHGGITFTNWPDDYIHSSDDDMWQMDRTTFKRNAVAVTAMAWYMANVGAKDAGTILRMTQLGGQSRRAQDQRNAEVSRIEGRANAWDLWAVDYYGRLREFAAQQSIATIDRGNAGYFNQNLDHLSLPAMFSSSPPSDGMRLIPVRASIKDYRDKVSDVKPVPGFHPVMRYEAFNLADGKRTVWDIYATLRAETLATGEWYYGKVTPEMVDTLFKNAAAAGILTLQAAEPQKPAVKKK
ncbi:MAG TPA: M28 family peptidase, partial [Terriglobales bacterium]|nr:M28 family peptidase [Terriglobales bacterium]